MTMSRAATCRSARSTRPGKAAAIPAGWSRISPAMAGWTRISLTALQTLFAREHNMLVDNMYAADPT